MSEAAKELEQAPRHRRTTPIRIPICLEAAPLFSQPLRVRTVGADEVPGVYKTIVKVIDAQRDPVGIVARFDPRITKMCGNASRAED